MFSPLSSQRKSIGFDNQSVKTMMKTNRTDIEAPKKKDKPRRSKSLTKRDRVKDRKKDKKKKDEFDDD